MLFTTSPFMTEIDGCHGRLRTSDNSLMHALTATILPLSEPTQSLGKTIRLIMLGFQRYRATKPSTATFGSEISLAIGEKNSAFWMSRYHGGTYLELIKTFIGQYPDSGGILVGIEACSSLDELGEANDGDLVTPGTA